MNITPFEITYKKNARYYLAAQPFRKGENIFMIKLTMIEAKPIQKMENGKIAKGITLKDGSVFLSYAIEHVK